MINKKNMIKVSVLVGVMTLTSVLVGCQSGKTISVDEQKKIVEQLNTMVAERKDSKELEAILDKNIKKMDKSTASDAINSFIYALYNENTDMISKMNYLEAELAEYVEANNIDILKKIDTKKMDDGLIKGLIQEVYANHLTFKNDGSRYFVVVDMQYVKNKYAKYMTDDLTAYTDFRIMEDSAIIFNGTTGTFDMAELTKRLIKIETESPKWQETVFKEQWNNSKEYYYAILFGINHSYFMDEKEPTKVKDDIILKYDEIIKNNGETEFGKELKEYVDIVKKSGNKISAEADDYKSKLMDEKFPVLTLEETNNETHQSTEEVQESNQKEQ